MMKKTIPDWFQLLYCYEREKYIEFTKNKCSQHQLQRTFVTCNLCQNDFKTANTREISCLTCWSVERNLKNTPSRN